MSCEHPESALVGIEPEFTWCSRCGSLAQFNEVYEKTWREPSLWHHDDVRDLLERHHEPGDHRPTYRVTCTCKAIREAMGPDGCGVLDLAGHDGDCPSFTPALEVKE